MNKDIVFKELTPENLPDNSPLNLRHAITHLTVLKKSVSDIQSDLATFKTSLDANKQITEGLKHQIHQARLIVSKYDNAQKAIDNAQSDIKLAEEYIAKMTKQIEKKENMSKKIVDKMNSIRNNVQRPRKNSLAEKLWRQFDKYFAESDSLSALKLKKQMRSDGFEFNASSEKAFQSWVQFNGLK